MRVCIVGSGLAGCLLAWRLRAAGVRVDIVTNAAADGSADATAVSGGLVRGFETEPAACADAATSLAELLASPLLREWARYEETGSTYACPRDSAELRGRTGIVSALVPRSVEVVDAATMRRERGWAGLPDGAVAVVERRAGHLSPAALRAATLADATAGKLVRALDGPVTALRPAAGGCSVTTPGETRDYDVVVVAAGRWTGALLRGNGIVEPAYRTKAIQYAVHDATGALPGPFVDDTSGLYGRRDGASRLLLGLPTRRFDVDPDRPAGEPALVSRAAALATTRFPGVALGPARRVVVAADCYTEPPGLRLRAVGDGTGLCTFTGGSGGAAKTALAASATAAGALLDGSADPSLPAAAASPLAIPT